MQPWAFTQPYGQQLDAYGCSVRRGATVMSTALAAAEPPCRAPNHHAREQDIGDALFTLSAATSGIVTHILPLPPLREAS